MPFFGVGWGWFARNYFNSMDNLDRLKAIGQGSSENIIITICLILYETYVSLPLYVS